KGSWSRLLPAGLTGLLGVQVVQAGEGAHLRERGREERYRIEDRAHRFEAEHRVRTPQQRSWLLPVAFAVCVGVLVALGRSCTSGRRVQTAVAPRPTAVPEQPRVTEHAPTPAPGVQPQTQPGVGLMTTLRLPNGASLTIPSDSFSVQLASYLA